MPDYDTEELTVLERFRLWLIENDGWERSDFEGTTFADVEDEYLAAGGVDFRPVS